MKYHVEKSIVISKPASEVRTLIADFMQWKPWSPWNIIEPDCPMSYEGIAGQPGHSMSWDGSVIGSGQNTLIEANDKGFHYDLEFFKPFKSRAKTSLLVSEADGKTTVTWTMDSKMPFFLFFMVASMKNWIGMDYERGLRMLKAMAETGSIPTTTTNKGIVDREGFSYVGIKRTVAMAEMKNAMGPDFKTLMDEIIEKRNKNAKHWVALYPKVNMKTMQFTYIAAASDEELTGMDLGSQFVRGSVSAGKGLEIKHDGSYEFLGNAWSMGMMNMRAKKMKKAGIPYEYYWNSPMEVRPEELQTSIYFPTK